MGNRQCDGTGDQARGSGRDKRSRIPTYSTEQSLQQVIAAEQQRLQSDISHQEQRTLSGIDDLVNYRRQLDAAKDAANQLAKQLKLKTSDAKATVPSSTVTVEKNGLTHLCSDVGVKHKKESSGNHNVSSRGEKQVSKSVSGNPTGGKEMATLKGDGSVSSRGEKPVSQSVGGIPTGSKGKAESGVSASVKSPKRQTTSSSVKSPKRQTTSPPPHVVSPKKPKTENKEVKQVKPEDSPKPEEENKQTDANSQSPVEPAVKSDDVSKPAFYFDNDGLPIWEAKKVPRDRIPPKPTDWEMSDWIKNLDDTYNNLRKKHFSILMKSCKRKLKRDEAEKEKVRKAEEEKKRKEEEEKQKLEKQRIEKERKEQLERERIEKENEEKRQKEMKELAKKMEEEAKQSINDLFKADIDALNIDISDDDEDTDTEPGSGAENGEKDSQEKGEFLKSPPKRSRGGNLCVPNLRLKRIDSGQNGSGNCSMKPFGGNLDDGNSSQCSDLSNISSVSVTPRRSMRSSSRTPTDLKKKRDLSAEMVQILSDPAIVDALEVFQGKKKGTDSDTEMLRDPKVLRALTALQADPDAGKGISASSSPIILSGGGDAPPIIPEEKIKKEFTEKKGRGAKRKLADYASFSAVVKNTPKTKKKKTEAQSSVTFSAGSPTRGILSSRDATTADLLKYCDVKVEVMKRLDNCMRKTPTTSTKITKGLFDTVSKIFRQKNC